MELDELKAILVDDVRPVARVARPLRLMARFGLLVASAFALGVWSLEPRAPVMTLLQSPSFLVDTALLLSVILAAFLTAVRLSLPGLTSGRYELTVLSALCVLAVARAATGSVPADEAHVLGHPEVTCAFPIAIFCAALSPISFGLVRSLAPMRPFLCAFLSLFATAAIGSLVLQWVCPDGTSHHVLSWHFMPAAALSVVAASVLKRYLQV